MVKGKYRGQKGTLQKIKEKEYCAEVELDNGKVLPHVDYECVCKLQDD